MAREGIFIRVERRLDAGWGVASQREEIYVGVSGGALLFHLLLFFTADRASPLEKYFTLQ